MIKKIGWKTLTSGGSEITEPEVRKPSLKSTLSLTLCVNLHLHLPVLGLKHFPQCKMNVRLNGVLGFLWH